MAVLISLIGGAVIVWVVIRSYGILSLPSFAALLYFLGFPFRMTLMQLTGDHSVFQIFSATAADYEAASLASLVSFIVMMGAVWAVTRRSLGRSVEPLAAPAGRPFVGGWALLGAIAVSAAQILLISQEYGGLQPAIEAFSRRNLGGDASALVTNLTFAAMPLFLLAVMVWARAGRRRAAIVATLLLLASLAWFSLFQGRAIIVVGIWAAAYAWWRGSGTPLRKKTRVLILVTIPTAAIVGLAWRTASQSGREFGEALASSLSEGLLVVSDSLPLFDHLEVGIRYSQTHGVGNLGNFLLDAFALLIPRELWPQKPEFVPQVLGQNVAYSDLSGLPAGLLGEGYMMAGWVGAIIFALLFGLFIGGLHQLLSSRGTTSPVFAWLMFTAFYATMVGLRTGAQSVLITMQLSLIYLAVAWLFSLILRGSSTGKPRVDDSRQSQRPLTHKTRKAA